MCPNIMEHLHSLQILLPSWPNSSWKKGEKKKRRHIYCQWDWINKYVKITLPKADCSVCLQEVMLFLHQKKLSFVSDIFEKLYNTFFVRQSVLGTTHQNHLHILRSDFSSYKWVLASQCLNWGWASPKTHYTF